MSNLRIARINYADSAILTVFNAIGSLPGSNLKDADIQHIWRSDTAANQAMVADLGQTVAIGFVGLFNTNMINNTVHIRVSTTDDTGVTGDAYNVAGIPAAVDPVKGMFMHFIDPAVTGRYVRINLNSLSEPPEAGRLVISPTWIPTRHFSFGWEDASEDHSRKSYSLGRNLLVDVLPRQPVWRFTLFGLTEAEKDDEIAEINRLNGTHKDILVCRDVTASNLGRVSIWGTLDDTLRPTQIRETNLFEVEFIIRARV